MNGCQLREHLMFFSPSNAQDEGRKVDKEDVGSENEHHRTTDFPIDIPEHSLILLA